MWCMKACTEICMPQAIAVMDTSLRELRSALAGEVGSSAPMNQPAAARQCCAVNG